jgi:hypothetical protein
MVLLVLVGSGRKEMGASGVVFQKNRGKINILKMQDGFSKGGVAWKI